jgi:hypothetical protein
MKLESTDAARQLANLPTPRSGGELAALNSTALPAIPSGCLTGKMAESPFRLKASLQNLPSASRKRPKMVSCQGMTSVVPKMLLNRGGL